MEEKKKLLRDLLTMDVALWSEQNVEKYLLNYRGISVKICGLFLHKFRINGKKLLSLNIAQIEHICNKAGVCVNEKNKLIKTVYEVQKGIGINTYNKLLDKKKYVFKSNEMRTGNNHDLKNSGKKWSEMDVLRMWILWRKYKNYDKVARLMNRTYLSVLTKINLIRRHIKESSNRSYFKPLEYGNPYTFGRSLLYLIKFQLQQENKYTQEQRVKYNRKYKC